MDLLRFTPMGFALFVVNLFQDVNANTIIAQTVAS